MPSLPHLAHSSLAEFLLQPVTPQLSGTLDLGAQLVDHSSPDIGHGHYEEIREYETEEEGQADQSRILNPDAYYYRR
jgi:hypothetical protein